MPTTPSPVPPASPADNQDSFLDPRLERIGAAQGGGAPDVA